MTLPESPDFLEACIAKAGSMVCSQYDAGNKTSAACYLVLQSRLIAARSPSTVQGMEIRRRIL